MCRVPPMTSRPPRNESHRTLIDLAKFARMARLACGQGEQLAELGMAHRIRRALVPLDRGHSLRLRA